LNFDLRNTSSGSVDVTFNQIQTSYTNDITGETWEYTIEKYIGNLSLFSAELKNTGESFLIAQIQEVYKETSMSEGVETSYTRIYSNLLYEIPFVLRAQEAQDTIESLEGGSLISFGYHSSSDRYEDGVHNYGIGINSSDNYVNLPQRAISLFESEIHPNDSVKVTYNYRGILGTLPPLDNDIANDKIYPYMAGTQGIYTDNMYIGDANQFIAFYTDGQGKKQLRIQANQVVFEVTDESGHHVDWKDVQEAADGKDGQDAIHVEIDPLGGNFIKRGQVGTYLIAHVYEGINDITNQFSNFIWYRRKADGTKDTSWSTTETSNQLYITTADVDESAVFVCEVTVTR
jgi:hypothetical protein